MLMIRLQRVGRKNIPVFRVVLTESQNSTKSGRYHEMLGSFDPVHNTKTINEERVKYWISKGAKLSDTMHNHLVSMKVISGKKINALPKKTPLKKEAPAEAPAAPAAPAAEAAAPAPEVPAAEAAPAETPAA